MSSGSAAPVSYTHLLFSRIGIDESTDQKTYLNRYNAAIKFLTLVAEVKVSIGTLSLIHI